MTDKKLPRIDGTALPNGWKVATLADVTEYIQRGKGPKYVEHSDLPIINQKCIRWFGIQKEHLKYVDPEQWNAWAAERYVRVGDVLWNSTGTGTIGRAALVKNLAPGEKYVVDSHVTIVRPKGIEPQYVHYWIMSPAVQGSIEAMQSGSTNQVELSKSAVEALPIPVAPLNQQKHIVAEIEKQFSRLDEAVANLKRVKANLKRYKAAVLKAAVEGHLVETEAELARRKGRSYETGEQLLQRILETRRRQWNGKGKYKEPASPDTADLPELPEGWVWASAIQACDPVVDCHNKTAPYKDSGIPLVRTTNIRDGRLLLDEVRYVDQSTYDFWSRRCPPEPGDVLFTREAPMGEAAIIPPGTKLCMGQRMMLMRPSNAISVAFLLYALMSPVIRQLIERTAVGSGVKHLRVGDVELLPIPIPPSSEQDRIVTEVDGRLSLVREVEIQVDANLIRSERLRQAILRQAFSGQLFPSEWGENWLNPLKKTSITHLVG